MLDTKRYLFKKFEKRIGAFFSRFPFNPNHYTLFSILLALFSFYFLVQEKLIFAILFFIVAGLLDLIDGSVARYRGIDNKLGAYLDTIVDRYVENILLIGCFFLPFPEVVFPSYVWIALIIFGSLMTTYSKAAAKEKELVDQELKGGLLSRAERIILLLISLFFGLFDPSYLFTIYVLIIIAILVNLTALQRIFSAIQKNRQ